MVSGQWSVCRVGRFYMPYNQITVEVPDKLRDLLIAELSGDDLAGVWKDPTQERQSQLVFYFSSSSQTQLLVRRIGSVFERAGAVVPSVISSIQQDMDWTVEWRKGYTSFDVGRGFRVVPSWEEVPSDSGRDVLRIDPGQAFGTGTHETTQMVIEALEKSKVTDHYVLDLGTGSGILSVAAMKLGWSRVAGCDLDPEALTVAADNFERNSVSVDLFAGSIDSVNSASVGLLLGNLTNDTIQCVLPEMSRVLIPGGFAILSGILDEQIEPLRLLVSERSYSVLSEERRGEWVALVIRHGDKIDLPSRSDHR